jgi:protein-tyrosine phosphatase
VIDLHCHVLPGLDDGPATLADALDLGRAQQTAGVTTVVATPHVGWDFPGVTAQRIAEAVAEVNGAFARHGIGVAVVAGAEVALTRAIELRDDELAALRLGGGPWLLLEPPHAPAGAPGTEAAIASLLHRGHRLVIAHPERCPAFLGDRAALERLVAGGALTSLTASALTGRFGRDARRFAAGLVEDGLAHDVASDAHGVSARRPPGMAEHVDGAGFGALTQWLCRAMPAAILAGDALPAPPEVEAPARGAALWRRLRTSFTIRR